MRQDCQSCRWWGRDENGKPNDGDGVSLYVTPADTFSSLPAKPGGDEREADFQRRLTLARSAAALYHLCNAIPEAWNVTEEQEVAAPPLALTVDGEEYRADLFTRAEFGCLLWQQEGLTP